MTGNTREFRLSAIALPILAPSVLFAVGEGALIPVIPALAASLGADLALAGFIAALVMVGTMLGDIPSGWMVARIGERSSMILAAVAAVAASLLGLISTTVAPNLPLLAVSVLVVGVAAAVFGLARHAFLTVYVPVRFRARSLSLLGGSFRAGWFVGPFLAAGVIAWAGPPTVVFWLPIILSVATVLVVVLVGDPQPHSLSGAPPVSRRTAGSHASTSSVVSRGTEFDQRDDSSKMSPAPPRRQSLWATLWHHRGVLVRVGSGVAIIQALRTSRMVLLPLWALGIGMSEPDTALVIGIGSTLDFVLFYTSGQIMDRWGRLWSIVPSMGGMGGALIVLSLTFHSTDPAAWFVAVTLAMGVANGLGSGIVLTIGADLAPKDNPAPFLGAFRFTGDAGGAVAPLLVSVLVAALSLPIAAASIGCLGFVAIGLMLRYVPRYVGLRPSQPPGQRTVT